MEIYFVEGTIKLAVSSPLNPFKFFTLKVQGETCWPRMGTRVVARGHFYFLGRFLISAIPLCVGIIGFGRSGVQSENDIQGRGAREMSKDKEHDEFSLVFICASSLCFFGVIRCDWHVPRGKKPGKGIKKATHPSGFGWSFFGIMKIIKIGKGKQENHPNGPFLSVSVVGETAGHRPALNSIIYYCNNCFY